MAEPFTPPGPGYWSLDLSHFAGGTTPLMQWLVTEATEAGGGSGRTRLVHGLREPCPRVVDDTSAAFTTPKSKPHC